MHELIQLEQTTAKLENRKPETISMILTNDKHPDQKQYNAPITNDVAIIFKSINGEPPVHRDILTWPRKNNELLIPSFKNTKTIRINTQLAICDPMQYPLIFPTGEFGWSDNLIFPTGEFGWSDNLKQSNSNKR